MPGTPIRGWHAAGSEALCSTSGSLPGGVPAFFNDLLQIKHLIHFDPWVTQPFPLGHPEFSTGSPKGSRAKKPNAADRELPLRQLLNQISKQKANKQGISERTCQKNLLPQRDRRER